MPVQELHKPEIKRFKWMYHENSLSQILSLISVLSLIFQMYLLKVSPRGDIIDLIGLIGYLP